MALNPSLVGKAYPSAEPYQVGREKIREFATAIGERSPLCHDASAARAAGYPDVIAPATFAWVLTMRMLQEVMADAALGLVYERAVHGEQRFDLRRPIVAGDEISATCSIADVAVRGANEVLRTTTELRAADGSLVATTTETIVSRGTAGGDR